MAFVNENYCNLKESFLFADIAHKVSAYAEAHPDKKIIRLGIGDVTLPLAKCVVDAMAKAVAEMGVQYTFRGYGPEQGYDFLHAALVKYYASFGVTLESDEIFISDGAKSDCANITDIFSNANTILIPDPVYPVYLDTNIMCGRHIIYMEGKPENDFLPMPDEKVKADVIYLCSPNNPTGSAYNKEQLEEWVAYALKNDAVILYDAAYEAYISEDDVAHSIYECEGARTCAIELRSFSKNAGFTGTRLGFTVVPKDLKAGDVTLHSLWARRHGTKYNGAPYIIQRAGEACYSAEGKAQLKEQVAFYMNNAKIIKEGLKDAGYTVFGGVNAPYIWLQTPDKMPSWDFFDFLLKNANVVGTPGSGFGPSGEGYFRLTAFGSHENTLKAIERIKAL